MSITTKLTETPRQGLDAVNPKLNQQYEQLVDLLARRLGPDHARLFAEPVPVTLARTGRPGLAWFAAGDGMVTSVTRLDPVQADALRRIAARLMAEVAAFADLLEGEGEASRDLARLLRDALVTPDDSHLWSLNGQPVLVAWGYRSARADGMVAERGGAITATATAPTAPTARPPGAASAGPPPPDAAGPSVPPPSGMKPVGRTGRGMAPVLWLLFVGLSAILGDRLLQACAMGGDIWPSWVRSVLPNHCPAPSLLVDPVEADQRAAIQATEAALHTAELALTRRALSCEASCPLPQRAALEAPRAIPADVERRLERIERGRDLELTLAWDGPADLDLQVICPDQTRIHFDRRMACGGRLVADQNSGGGTRDSRPIEHVIWDETPSPEGSFGIAVSLYGRHGDARPAIPFRIVLSRHGQIVREQAGEVAALRVPLSLFTFLVPFAPSPGAAAVP